MDFNSSPRVLVCPAWCDRCGIHKGAVVGALLGCLRRKYSLFGDVVNR